MEENVSTVELPKKRPSFLTVLCILSFIGSGGFGLLYSVYNYFTFDSSYPAQVQKITEGLEKMEDAGMDSGFFYKNAERGLVQLEAMSKNLGLITGANCLFALLSLLGIFMMWKLKKNGFYLYLVANLFWLLVPLGLIDFDATFVNTMIGAGITALFAILYALNLKHME